MGYLQSGGDPRAAAQGAVTAGVFGMMGGLGQLGHYNSIAELRQARIADRRRFLKLSRHKIPSCSIRSIPTTSSQSVLTRLRIQIWISTFSQTETRPTGSGLADLPRGQAQINILWAEQ